jgi:hypothetical protein
MSPRDIVVARQLPQGRESRLWCMLVVEALDGGSSLVDAMVTARRLVVDETVVPVKLFLAGPPSSTWSLLLSRGWIDTAAVVELGRLLGRDRNAARSFDDLTLRGAQARASNRA